MPRASTNTERIAQYPANVQAQQQTAAPAPTTPMTDEQRRAAIEAELMENRPSAPEVAQPLGGRRIRIVTRTLNGDKRVSAQLFEVPGYNGPQLCVAEYKSTLGQGYRIYLAKTGMFLDDNNGVATLNDVLNVAVQRVRNARARIAAERAPTASPAESIALGGLDQMHDCAIDDEAADDAPGMR